MWRHGSIREGCGSRSHPLGHAAWEPATAILFQEDDYAACLVLLGTRRCGAGTSARDARWARQGFWTWVETLLRGLVRPARCGRKAESQEKWDGSRGFNGD
jgi:hypothetical protein